MTSLEMPSPVLSAYDRSLPRKRMAAGVLVFDGGRLARGQLVSIRLQEEELRGQGAAAHGTSGERLRGAVRTQVL